MVSLQCAASCVLAMVRCGCWVDVCPRPAVPPCVAAAEAEAAGAAGAAGAGEVLDDLNELEAEEEEEGPPALDSAPASPRASLRTHKAKKLAGSAAWVGKGEAVVQGDKMYK